VPARAPGLVFPPTPISLYNPVQLHSICRRPPILLSPFTPPAQPPATLRRPPQSNRPVTKPTYNGSAHLKLPARAVLCAFAGPLIKDHGANTHTYHQPTLESDCLSQQFLLPRQSSVATCNAGLILKALRASATFPPARKVLTCASTSPPTDRSYLRFLARRSRGLITGLQSCESYILLVHCCAQLGHYTTSFLLRRLVFSAFTLLGAISRDHTVNLRNDIHDTPTCLRLQNRRARSPLHTLKYPSIHRRKKTPS
jgi:hypothetical protein